MVGLMNTSVTTLLSLFSRLLNSHLIIGIRDSKGTPEPVSVLSVRSKPPNTIISSFFALMSEVNLLVDLGGGAFCGGFPIKSEILTLMFRVT